jgi:RNA ligase (TIGR02306 family)
MLEFFIKTEQEKNFTKMENNNSVCYVARIAEVKPIPGADNIEQGVIGGWNCIIKKGEYKADDLVIVATTDAVIPQELSDGMNVTNYLRKGQRVRTVKLRGVYSECLIIPLRYAEKLTHPKAKWAEGADMMDLLKIYKYEPPVTQIQLSTGKKVRYHQNPNFKVYHKFPNLKNVSGMFTEEDRVEITRKLHGTNARYGIVRKNKLSVMDRVKRWAFKTFHGTPERWAWIDYEYVYGSHNVEKGSESQGFYSTDVWREVADMYGIKEKLWNHVTEHYDPEHLGEGLVLYGEVYGPGIQKNYDYGLKSLQFAGFDVTVNGEYMDTSGAWFIIESMDLSYVPVLYVGNWSQKIQDKHTFNNFISDTKVPHEGIVIKHVSGERNKVAKVINPDYLIWGEKHDVGDSH